MFLAAGIMNLKGIKRQKKNISVALIDHVGADLIAVKRDNLSVRYAISVKGRNTGNF